MNIGDKVVCVDDSKCCCCGFKVPNLLLNSVDVIDDTRLGSLGLYIHLLGRDLVCQCTESGTYALAKRFRKLDELKQEAGQRQSQTQSA